MTAVPALGYPPAAVPGPIVFCMLQEAGHVHPTFKLARSLLRRGLDVAYFAADDLAPLVETQGFRTLPWFPELRPADDDSGASDDEGLTPTSATTSATTRVDGDLLARVRSPLRRRQRITRRYLHMAEELLAGRGPAAELERERPALALVDVTQSLVAYACRRAGVPMVSVHTALPQTRDPGVPPPRTGLPQGDGLRARLRADLAWQRFLLRRRVLARAAERVGACPPYELARTLATRFGLSLAEIDAETAFMPQLRGTPEIVLCPEALDFPRPKPPLPGRHYVESIDIERAEDDLHLPTSAAGRPLVYASLGSQLYQAAHARRLLHLLVEAFRRRPAWQLVLSLGRYAGVHELGPLPDNIVAHSRVPQLSVLRRARLMVTHGGLGSIKECVMHSVPMLVFPLDVDQPGNAARVVHHGLGLRGDVRSVTGPDLLDLLDRLMHEERFQRHVAALHATFERVEQAGEGAALVEAMAAPGGGITPARVAPG